MSSQTENKMDISKFKTFKTKKRDFFELTRCLNHPFILITKEEYQQLGAMLTKDKTDGLTDGANTWTIGMSGNDEYRLWPLNVPERPN